MTAPADERARSRAPGGLLDRLDAALRPPYDGWSSLLIECRTQIARLLDAADRAERALARCNREDEIKANVNAQLLARAEAAERERDDYRTGKQECWDLYVAERARVERLEAELFAARTRFGDARAERLEAALRMIAGEAQCADNLMSDKDIARATLAEPAPDAERAADKGA